jgi:hypothetical protein
MLVSYFQKEKTLEKVSGKGADRKLGGGNIDDNQAKGKYKEEVRSIYMLYWNNV